MAKASKPSKKTKDALKAKAASAQKKPAPKAKPAPKPPAAKPAGKPVSKTVAKKTHDAKPKVDAKARPDLKGKPEPTPKHDPKAKVDAKTDGKLPKGGKLPAAKPSVAKPSAAKPPTAKPVDAAPDDKKAGGRKGITIVAPKPVKRPRVKAPVMPDITLAPVRPISRTPLIPSGAKAAQQIPLGAQGEHQTAERPKAKTILNKKDLAKFRALLVKKRAELIGDVSTMEEEALRGESGSLSSLPQHIADQGSDTYDQALALEIVAADRKLVKEIDDAIKRIDDGTYGMCELTGRPISPARLEELPWARYSIEAARELERRSMRS